MPALLIVPSLLFYLLAASLQAQDDATGLFADFQTSLGSFSASLAWEEAPQTVASFIGLADGSRNWLDFESGRSRHTPFYDGIIFHRVIKGFVIQAGSPAGDGTDGPGYSFQDELDTGLRHDGPYILSMANSGPNSNGSQFFITLAATPHLDAKHSVFGTVVAGRDVVDAIGMVEVGNQSRPLNDVVIERVTIRRSGEAAAAFDEHAQGLPNVADILPRVERRDGVWRLAFTQENNADYRLFHSADLLDWSERQVRLNTSPTASAFSMNLADEIGEVSRRFYRLVEIAYPDDLLTPEAVGGREFHFDITSHGWSLAVTLDEAGEGGTFVMNGTPPDTWSGMINSVQWQAHPYRGILFLQFETGTIVPARLQTVFHTPENGTFRGTLLTTTGLEISGSFTVAPPSESD